MEDSVFRQIVREFVVKVEGRIEEMEGLVNEHHWSELASAAHWLKGSGGTAGFHDLTAPSARLERAAKTSDAAGAAKALAEIRSLASRLRSPELFGEAPQAMKS
jgi:HPt (histidine-containing phosphotransfer) domain-containing protein